MAFKDELKARREALGMKQYDLSHALGMCPATIHKWERGVVKPRFEHLVALARFLGVSESDLLRNEPVKGKSDSLHTEEKNEYTNNVQ